MKNEKAHMEFDFSKVITEPIKKLEKQSYKKVLFLAIGLAVFTTLGISIKDSIHNHFEKSNALEDKKVALSLQEIKSMSDSDFEAMTNYIMQNSNIYDEKVHFIQTIIAKAEQEDYQNSMTTERASTLGELLNKYKQTLATDSSKLVLVRKSIINNLSVDRDDTDLFFKYQTLYKTKSIIHDRDLDDHMQEYLYSSNTGNNKYNNKNNVYDTIKAFDQKINNTFNAIEVPKPKM